MREVERSALRDYLSKQYDEYIEYKRNARREIEEQVKVAVRARKVQLATEMNDALGRGLRKADLQYVIRTRDGNRLKEILELVPEDERAEIHRGRPVLNASGNPVRRVPYTINGDKESVTFYENLDGTPLETPMTLPLTHSSLGVMMFTWDVNNTEQVTFTNNQDARALFGLAEKIGKDK